MTRSFAVKSFGCQMNVYDSERMAEVLAANGYKVSTGDEADIVILNTCHVREHAAEKLYHEIGRIAARAGRKGSAKPVVAVAGCVAQAEGGEILRRARAADLVVGPQAYHRLPELLQRQAAGEMDIVDLDMPAVSKFEHLPPRTLRTPSAFLTVQEGCDKFCNFCVVPYTRGCEVSRPLHDVLAEATALLAGGACEITLLGQNVNAWHDGTHDFAALLHAVAGLAGLVRLRYTTSHPMDVTEGMIRAHAEIPQLMPYLHLPVQSGSDRVLQGMNRRYDRKAYLGLVARFRAARPDLAITSDFIVGYPGESDADFEETLGIVGEVGYAQAFSFCYSPRLGTPAAERQDQVADAVKKERLQRLQAAIATAALAFNRRMLGGTCEILVERRGRRGGQWIGKSPWLQSVVVEAADLVPGRMVTVELVAATASSLEGRICGQHG